MDTVKELRKICQEKNIDTRGKKKAELLELLGLATMKIQRLNYIGSKFQLLDWITLKISEKTKWTDFGDKVIGDLFSGTGVVSYHFRKMGAKVVANDSELYSVVITRALASSVYSQKCRDIIEEMNNDMGKLDGYVSQNYSPSGSERMFFTVSNANRIDYLRHKLDKIKDIDENEYNFILASIIVSADAVSNVPAVYGCFLKKFKDKALKDIVITPIHTNEISCNDSIVFHGDIMHQEFPKMDMVYLDPPYNARQYSKNYFPLNIIAKTEEEQNASKLKGVTGIPTDCFSSSFCKKDAISSFEALFKRLNAKWIFLSYNSESIVSKEKMISIMEKYGNVSVFEKDYKRFKSFEYNEDKSIKEYLFCLETTL